MCSLFFFFFFFQAEDGIRDIGVTGVQTCALPISPPPRQKPQQIAVQNEEEEGEDVGRELGAVVADVGDGDVVARSEERRVGKECRYRWSRYQYKKKREEVSRRQKTRKQTAELTDR